MVLDKTGTLTTGRLRLDKVTLLGRSDAATVLALALPLAAAGFIGPWEAALAMGASSLTVLLNALRTLESRKTWKASTSSFPSPSPSYS